MKKNIITANEIRIRKKMIVWVEYHLSHFTYVLSDCTGWLAKTGFNDFRIAVRQCDIDLIFDLEILRDELKSERRFGVGM